MPKNGLSKLGLGTVQFGLDYGISNKFGKTPLTEIERILDLANQSGVTTLDTAHLYGDSEAVLGQAILDSHKFDIVTKTISSRENGFGEVDLKTVEVGFCKSLSLLKVKSVYGILLHNAEDLKSDNANLLYNLLGQFKRDQLVKKIGVSVYDIEQINFILDHFSINLIQLPMNVFDQRLLQNGVLEKIKRQGIEIHVRSAFLQGLIFMQPEELPEKLKSLSSKLQRFQNYVRDLNIHPAAAALSFLMEQDVVDKVVCGVNSFDQFKTLIDLVSKLPKIDEKFFASLAVSNPAVVNPNNW